MVGLRHGRSPSRSCSPRSPPGGGRRGSARSRRRPGTLLITDAWFDIVLESHSDELRKAIYLAVFAELPLAALCFWIAYRTERFLALLVRAGATSRAGR